MAFSVVRLAARSGKRAEQITLGNRRVKKTSTVRMAGRRRVLGNAAALLALGGDTEPRGQKQDKRFWVNLEKCDK